MREYPVKKKHEINEDKIESLMKDIFGNVKKDGEFFISNYGSLDYIKVKLKGKKLYAETKSNNNKEKYQDTISKYNDFIEKVTGYTAAERKKLLTKT